MERKVIKRLSNTSYWSDGVGLWLKPNVGGEFREKDVSVVSGRKWHKDVGFLDSYFKEPFSEIPEIQFVRVSPKVIEEKKSEEKPVLIANITETANKPIANFKKISLEDREKVVADYMLGLGSRAVGVKWGISDRMVMRYVKAAGVEYRAASGRKKAPTS